MDVLENSRGQRPLEQITMKLDPKRGVGTASLLRLVAVLSCIFFSAPAAKAQCTDATATRPILFVPGFNENSTAWGTGGAGVRGWVMSKLAETPGYSSANAQTEYHLYFD